MMGGCERMGRITKDSVPAHKAEICAAIARGESLLGYLRKAGSPGYSSVTQWLLTDAEFAANYARAREAQADADADKISFIAEQVAEGKLDPQAARVAIDALKWTAGKRQPKKYGDKLDIDARVGVVVEGAVVKFVGDDEPKTIRHDSPTQALIKPQEPRE